MDTDRIQINVDTPVEVEYHFSIKDVSGKKHQAMIRYQYPLFVKDYWRFLRKVTRLWSYESDPLWSSKVTRLS